MQMFPGRDQDTALGGTCPVKGCAWNSFILLYSALRDRFFCHSVPKGLDLEPYPIRAMGRGRRNCQSGARLGRGCEVQRTRGVFSTPLRSALASVTERRPGKSVAASVTLGPPLAAGSRGTTLEHPGSREMVRVRGQVSPKWGKAGWNRPEPAAAKPGPPPPSAPGSGT